MRGRLARRRREEGAGGQWQGRAEPPLAAPPARPMCEAAAAAGSRRRHFGCGGQCRAASACRDSVATRGPGREGGRGGGRGRSREPPRRVGGWGRSRPYRRRLGEQPGGTRGPGRAGPRCPPAAQPRSLRSVTRRSCGRTPRAAVREGGPQPAWGVRPELPGTALSRFGRMKRPERTAPLRASRLAPQV